MWPRRLWPLLLAAVAVVTINAFILHVIAVEGKVNPYGDGAGILWMVLIVYVDVPFIGVLVAAGISRLRRWRRSRT